MSYDLWVWAGPPYSSTAIRKAVDRFVEQGDGEPLDPSPALLDLHAAALLRYPALESIPEARIESGVWSVTPEVSDRLIAFTIQRPRADEVATFLVKEAFDRGLFTFDPQDMAIYPPKWTEGTSVLTDLRSGSA
jgi:hypothetical protein